MAASVKVILRDDKANKAGEAPLYLRVTKDRKSKYVALGILVKPELWNESERKVKKAYPNSQRVNAFIAQKVAEAEGLTLELQMESKFVPVVSIKRALMGQTSGSFLKYFERYLTTLEKKGKVGMYRRIKAVYEKLKAYLGNNDLSFDEVTVSFLKQYEGYLRNDLQNATNTIHANLKVFRKLINDAKAEDLVSAEKDPFQKYKLKLEKTKKHYLTDEQLEKVETLPLPTAGRMHHHRNMFVFACYAGGLRVSDVLQLRWENYTGTHVKTTIQKTGDVVAVKLPTKAIAILEHYKSDSTNPKAYIFPFLDAEKEYTKEQFFQAISSATAFANKNLQAIAAKAAIEVKISFHSSRHTFATRALTKGMRIEHVSKLMGHSNIQTTQIYAKIVSEELDKAMEVFN